MDERWMEYERVALSIVRGPQPRSAEVDFVKLESLFEVDLAAVYGDVMF